MSVRILIGDVRAKLAELPDESVNCVVTSPPYFGLRDYGTASWSGGNAECAHEGSERYYTEKTAGAASSGAFSEAGEANAERLRKGRWREGGQCTKCGARHADLQIGLEPTPAAFAAVMVDVFREVRRVLREDGTFWLNLGDSYNAYNGGAGPGSKLSKNQTEQRPQLDTGYGLKFKGLKPNAMEERMDNVPPPDETSAGLPRRSPYRARTAMSFWLPQLEAAGLPVPKTRLFQMPEAAQEDLFGAFDGKPGTGALAQFADTLKDAAAEVGFPCFLRTDHTSNKHDWEQACFVASPDQIAGHVATIAMFSEICDMMGLPWDTWAVREFLPTTPFGVCPDFGNMPICREFRFFVNDGVIQCAHPYWPLYALEQGGAPASLDYAGLCRMDNEKELRALAEAAGRACPGSWSIDLLETKRGWYVTDMAEAGNSFHWDGCPHAKTKNAARGR